MTKDRLAPQLGAAGPARWLVALVACLALFALLPRAAAARIAAWRIASYSLTFTEHATATASPCDAEYDGPAADNHIRAASEDATFSLGHWHYRPPLFMYDYLAHGPASSGEIDGGGLLTEDRHVTQTVVDCRTGATSARACGSSARYRGGNAEPWGLIESMTTSRHKHRVTIEWGFPPDGGYDCDGDLGLGPPVPLDSLVKTRLRVRAFYRTRTVIRFSRTSKGDDGFGTSGAQTLAGRLVLRRTTEPGSCFPGAHPDRHFTCTRH
jgi:hypothetical protein